MLRLEPMDDDSFRTFLDRHITRRAERWVRRGVWRADRAVETCRKEYEELLPQGRTTPGHHFVHAVAAETGAVVGEAWYRARESGGKIDFYIHWIGIEPEFQRRGYGTRLLQLLEDEARKLGAPRTTLSVWTDNPVAHAMYRKLGYVVLNVTMGKEVPAEAEAVLR
jgi:ribosomal protein S18 acetylase RimI-like enzyme